MVAARPALSVPGEPWAPDVPHVRRDDQAPARPIAPEPGPPWPFSRAEIESVAQDGVKLVGLETIRDGARYWAEFTR